MTTILHVCHSDQGGGAAIAAHRLVRAQRDRGIDARMLVLHKLGDDLYVQQVSGFAVRSRVRAARFVAKRIGAMLSVSDPQAMRTLAAIPTGIGRQIIRRAPDIVHWHWVGGEMLSLSEMASTGIPSVWTCHDEWAFCGAEHYPPDRRFAAGYGSSLCDADAVTFRRKHAAWHGWSPVLICPSHWMAREAAESALMSGAETAVIANTLDVDVFRPMERAEARRCLGLPSDRHIILFGAFLGTTDPRKGFDLMAAALEELPERWRPKVALATFGDGGGVDELAGFPVVPLGRINDERKLAAVYSAADMLVAPSRQDNLPNTVVEAQACGTPCVGFAVGGMGDIVERPYHGRLVAPFDVQALAGAMQEVLDDGASFDRARMRSDAVSRFGPDVIVTRHQQLYGQVMERAR